MAKIPLRKKHLVSHFCEAGLQRAKNLIMHSSLSSLGWADGGADAVIDAVLEVLGPESTLMVPPFNYSLWDEVFDPKGAPSHPGAITNALRQRPEAVWSLHPSYLIASAVEQTDNLTSLKLPWIRENFELLSNQAAQLQWTHLGYLRRLVEGETHLRMQRATQRRIKATRFPVIKALEQFDWSWLQKINRVQIQNLFRLNFITHKANVIFLGGVSLGKTHLARP